MANLQRIARPALNASSQSLKVASRQPVAGFHSSTTQMATLRELEQRVKSVKNIEKITKVSSQTQGSAHSSLLDSDLRITDRDTRLCCSSFPLILNPLLPSCPTYPQTMSVILNSFTSQWKWLPLPSWTRLNVQWTLQRYTVKPTMVSKEERRWIVWNRKQ